MLAAGSSIRMGKPKLLLTLGGRTILEMSVENHLASRLSYLCVVVPGWDGRFDSILGGMESDRLHILTIREPCPMSESLKRGWGWLVENTDVDAIMISLADMPLIRPYLINLLIDAYTASESEMCIPFYKNMRGHPVVISCDLTEEIMKLSGDVGARQLAERKHISLKRVDVNDDGVIFDVDNEQDLENLKIRLMSNG